MNDEQNKDFEAMQKSLKELEDINNTVAKAYDIYKKFPDSEEVASQYVKTLDSLAEKQDNLADVESTVTKAYGVYEKFSDSEDVAFQYISALNTLASSQKSLADVTGTVAKAYGVYEKFPDSEDVASFYVGILYTLAKRQGSLADVTGTVAKAYGVYEKFPDSEAVASFYVGTLYTLAKRQGSLADITGTVAKAYGVYEKFPDSETVASFYVGTLYTLAKRQESLADITETVAKAYGVYEKFPDSETLAYFYVGTLYTLAKRQESLADITETVAKVYGIYEKFPDSEAVASFYVGTLYTLASSQKSLADVTETVAKAYGVYEKFPDSEDVASFYVGTLYTLAKRQGSLADITETVAKAYGIYEKFPDSEAVAYAYAKALVYLEIRQDTEQDLMKTFDKVIEIYKKFSNKENIRNLLEDLISEDIIGNIFYSNDNLDSFNRDVVPVIKKMFNTIIELDGLKLPGYAPLIELLKHLEDSDKEQLIRIYQIVQKIKYQLSIKDLSEKKFGHYTSGDVLQILLKQSSDNKGKYSIEGRTRLGNVKYMNDPEEGTILDKYLGISESDNLEDSLKPSPWFLMSLTTKVDNLSMWSQYGDSAEGVCLVLKTDSFKVYQSMAETEWIGKYAILERKLTSTKYEETNASYKKDYLYRICYLDEKSLINGNLIVVKENNNNLLDDKEITSINKSLGELKVILDDIKKNASLYSTINKCLEEIRYLFKVSDYSYESELRILRYADLTPDNKEIKIDNSGPVAKLFLERDMPIQLEQVIFGPKFSNPEHVTPLLHLLDKNIGLKLSKIKFK